MRLIIPAFLLLILLSTVCQVQAYNWDHMTLGATDAPVLMEAFIDYTCPFCGKWYAETLPQLVEDYIDDGKLRVMIYHYPLGIHLNDMEAAIAVDCASRYGKTETYTLLVFQNEYKLTRSDLLGYAKAVRLDTKTFEDCLDNPDIEENIDDDIDEGRSKGIKGTPTFYVNGEKIGGYVTYNVFTEVIDRKYDIARVCTDSDKGRSIYKKGVTRGLDASQKMRDWIDFCEDDAHLREYVCATDGRHINGHYIECDIACRDGACLIKEDDCTDSDGGKNYSVKGETKKTGASDGNVDSCTGNRLSEFYCNDLGGTSEEFHICLCRCIDGSCIREGDPDCVKELCSDPDGRDYFKRGFSKGQSKPDGDYDHCSKWEDSNILYEYYCDAGELKIESYDCPKDYVCQNGACVVEDSDKCVDEGDDYYIQHKVVIYKKNGEVYTNADECMSDGRVQEQTCCDSEDYPGSKNFCAKYLACPNGCGDGACLDKEEIKDCGTLFFYYDDNCINCQRQEFVIEKIMEEEDCLLLERIKIDRTNPVQNKYGVNTVPALGYLKDDCMKIKEDYASYDAVKRWMREGECVKTIRPSTTTTQAPTPTVIPSVCPKPSCRDISKDCVGDDLVVKKQCTIYKQEGTDCLKETTESENLIVDGCFNEMPDCPGCNLRGKCLPVGTRTSGDYCDLDYHMERQKPSGKGCDNSYECQSNLCIDGKCIKPGLFERIISWFNRMIF